MWRTKQRVFGGEKTPSGTEAWKVKGGGITSKKLVIMGNEANMVRGRLDGNEGAVR